MDKRKLILTITVSLIVWMGLSYGWYMFQGPQNGENDVQIDDTTLDLDSEKLEVKIKDEVTFFAPKNKEIDVEGDYDRIRIRIDSDEGTPSGIYYEYNGDISSIRSNNDNNILLFYEPGFYDVKKSGETITLEKKIRPTEEGLVGISTSKKQIKIDNWTFDIIRKVMWSVFMAVIGVFGFLMIRND